MRYLHLHFGQKWFTLSTKKFSEFFSVNEAKPSFAKVSEDEGFTIVELLMYMGLLAILLTVLISIFSSALDVQLESDGTSAVEQDGRFIIAKLTHDVTSASSMTTPTSLGQSSGALALVEGGTTISFTVDGNGNLAFTTGGVSYPLNSYGTTVSQFSVQRIGNVGGVEDTVSLHFTLTSKTKRTNGSEVRAYQTAIAMRRQ